jgi:hypothetical protein
MSSSPPPSPPPPPPPQDLGKSGIQSRRNFRQEQLASRMEQLQVLINNIATSVIASDPQKEASLHRLFEERDECSRKLRALQLNQSRQRRFRARKEQSENIDGTAVSVKSESNCRSVSSSPLPSAVISTTTLLCSPASSDSTTAHSPQLLSMEQFSIDFSAGVDELVRLITADELQFLDNVAQNLNHRTTAQTAEILLLRKVFVADRAHIGEDSAKATLYLRLQCKSL